MSKSVMELMREWDRTSRPDDPSVLMNASDLRLLLAAVEAAWGHEMQCPNRDQRLREALDALYAKGEA